MISILSILALSLATAVLSQDTDIHTVEATLKSTGLIPDIIADFVLKAPLEVTFLASPLVTVTAGANLTMAQTAHIPTFAFQSNNTAILGEKYTIIMLDPDAPSPPNRTLASFLHYIGKDFTSSELTSGNTFTLSNQSTAIEEYFPPSPPNGSLPHRYLVAAYLQTSSISAPANFNPDVRVLFNLTQFLNDVHSLTPVAASMFFVGPESSPNASSPSGTAAAGASAQSARSNRASHLSLGDLSAVGSILAISLSLLCSVGY